VPLRYRFSQGIQAVLGIEGLRELFILVKHAHPINSPSGFPGFLHELLEKIGLMSPVKISDADMND
jgi:hypothetical protein